MYESAVQNLIDELGRLPGVGPKSAQRIAFYILNSDAGEMAKLTDAISRVKKTVSFCDICGNVSETKLCTICRDEQRDPSILCVVEESKDVVAVERTRSFTGRYHVLGGSINPMAGIGPEQLRIRELVARLSDERITELILAMDPNLEGEATATYLSRLLVPIGIRVSRLASGLPVGGDLEYADEVTLGRALEGRRIISEGNRAEITNPAEDFHAALEAEAHEAAQAAEPQAPRARWSGSMFEDLDADSNSAPEQVQEPAVAPTRPSAETPGQAQQGDLNEVLLTQEIAAIPGELSPEERAERAAAAAFDAETSEPGDELSQERQGAYRAKLEELKKTPLRTVAPKVPPIPGKTYVNPWV